MGLFPVNTIQSHKSIPAVLAKGGAAIITADHGNAEQLIDPGTGGPHTAHTTNPVQCILLTSDADGRASVTLRAEGKLADVAPTILELLRIPQPAQMSGQSLLTHLGS